MITYRLTVIGGVWFIVVCAVAGCVVMLRSLVREPERHRSSNSTLIVPGIYALTVVLSTLQEAVFFPYD